MRKIILYILIFILSATLIVYFQDNIHKVIRLLYHNLTSEKIVFNIPKLDIYFPSLYLITISGFILTITAFCFLQLTPKQKILNSFIFLLLLPLTIIIYCYLDGTTRIVTCTICKDFLYLNYSDINYDKITITSIILSSLPIIVNAKINYWKNTYKKASH